MRNFNITKLLAFLFVLGLAGLPCSTFVSALTYQQEIGVSFTFNPALRLTVSADLYIYNLAPGTASDSNIINVNVLTNTINGYTLTATVGNSTTYNTRNLVHSNSNINNTFTSVDYSATPTITTNTNLGSNKWAFSFSTDNGSNWSNYNGLPLYSDTTNIATLKETNGPVATTTGDDIKFKIAANASSDQASGEYNNVINFNLAAKVLPQYTVVFDANTGSGTMPNQIIFRDEATMLATNLFTPPTGLVFDGWNTAANGSGTAYADQQSVTNLAADGGSITLYAQWKDPTKYMQSIADWIDDVAIGEEVITVDRRDNKEYYALRLSSGYMLMTQNLDHDIVTTTNYYTPANTDITANWTSPYATSNYSEFDSQTELYPAPQSYDPGNKYWNGTIDSDEEFDGSLDNSKYISTSGDAHYHVGNYYNFAAATAVTDPSTINSDAGQSICPAGWTLPLSLNASDSWGEIIDLYSQETLYESPLYFSLVSLVGYSGQWWSRERPTNRGAPSAYSLRLTIDARWGIIRNLQSYLSEGLSVRCISRIGKVDYMQDQTQSTLAALMPNVGDEVTLYDKRDEKLYTVKNINGQYWMTQNLRYLGDTGSTAGTMTIGNSNSNVTNKSITLYSLDSSNAGNFGAYTNHCDSTNSYNYACVYDSGSTTTGVWYNYYAATAGTISTDSNSTAATSDICPAGWHLPTGPSTTAGTDFNILVGNTTSGYQDPTAGLTAFSAVAGGYYSSGSLYNTGNGLWWSATAGSAPYRYYLGYTSSTSQFAGNSSNSRLIGIFIRCMRS